MSHEQRPHALWAEGIIIVSVITVAQLLGGSRVFAEPWSVQASLGVSGKFDDNVRLTAENETRDLTMAITPAVRVMRTGEHTTFSVGYHTAFELYHQQTDLNNTAHTARVSLTATGLGRGFFEHIKIEMSDAFTFAQRLVDVPAEGEAVGNEGVITEPNDTWHNGASARLTLPFTDSLSGSASYSHSVTEFSHPSLIDSTVQSAGAGLARQWTERTLVSATYGIRLQETETRKRVSHALGVGVDTKFTPTLDGRLGAGAAYFPDGRRVHAVGEASLTKRFQYAAAAVSYRRQVGSGGGVFQDPTVSQSIGVELTRPFGERASAILSGGYSDHRSATTEAGDSRSFRFGASARYTLTQWLRASAAFHHLIQQATGTSPVASDARRNTIMLTLIGTWGAPTP